MTQNDMLVFCDAVKTNIGDLAQSHGADAEMVPTGRQFCTGAPSCWLTAQRRERCIDAVSTRHPRCRRCPSPATGEAGGNSGIGGPAGATNG